LIYRECPNIQITRESRGIPRTVQQGFPDWRGLFCKIRTALLREAQNFWLVAAKPDDHPDCDNRKTYSYSKGFRQGVYFR